MKTIYKYIEFIEVLHAEKNNGRLFKICNRTSKGWIGTIGYYKRWRQYVFEGKEDCIFNKDCLLHIIDFLRQLNREEKQ